MAGVKMFLFRGRTESMLIRFILLLFVSLVLCDLKICYGQEYIYTWKDKNGVLNITDYAPPTDAQILDISPSYREEAEKYRRQQRMFQERARPLEQQQKTQEKIAPSQKKDDKASAIPGKPPEEQKSPVKKKKGY
jgi:Zn-dependent protease with chaperone function